MSDIPQFFQTPSPPTPEQATVTRNDLALYRVADQDTGDEILILVEGVEGTSNIPRNATSFASISDKLDLEKHLQAAAAVARTAIDSMRKLAPGEVTIEFGIELGGETRIPLITKGEAKANFKITLTWKEQEAKATP